MVLLEQASAFIAAPLQPATHPQVVLMSTLILAASGGGLDGDGYWSVVAVLVILMLIRGMLK